MSELSLHEAIFTTRAMRRLAPDPVDEADLRYLVEAATQAPSGTNAQPWAFVIVTDAARRRALGEIYREVGSPLIRGVLESGRLDEDTQRVYRQALRMADQVGEAPALVLACMRGRPPADPVAQASYYGSIFPAIQNLILAARSRGLGTVLTTIHKAGEEKVKSLLGIPDDVETIALLPVGRPLGRWGRPRRHPAESVTHWDGWRADRESPTPP